MSLTSVQARKKIEEGAALSSPLHKTVSTVNFPYDSSSSMANPAIDTLKKNSKLSFTSWLKSFFGRSPKVDETKESEKPDARRTTKGAASKPELENPQAITKEQLLKLVSEIEQLMLAVQKLREEPEENYQDNQNEKDARLFSRSLKMLCSHKDLLDEASLLKALETGYKQKEFKEIHKTYMQKVENRDDIKKKKKFWGRIELGALITGSTAFGLSLLINAFSAISGGTLSPLAAFIGPALNTLSSTATLMQGVGVLKNGLLEYDFSHKMGEMNDLKHQSETHQIVLDQLSAELTRMQETIIEICKQLRQTISNTSETISLLRA